MNRQTKKYFLNDTDETDTLINSFCETLKPSTTVILNGQMGTGKTYISKRIASFYGIRDLTSSSYQQVTLHSGEMNIVHCDFYRNKFSDQFFFEEIEPLLKHPWILLLEWFSLEDMIPEMGYIQHFSIKNKGSTKRTIKISKY